MGTTMADMTTMKWFRMRRQLERRVLSKMPLRRPRGTCPVHVQCLFARCGLSFAWLKIWKVMKTIGQDQDVFFFFLKKKNTPGSLKVK